MPKIFISTVPFGQFDPRPIELLKQAGLEYTINPLGRKLSPEEVADLARDYDGLIAGTEHLGQLVAAANKLKIISRVGIGLDSVPLHDCRHRGIAVTYTPDAVTNAVAELTVGGMVCISRFVLQADRAVRSGQWQRLVGRRLGESRIGIIGMGRIGNAVIRLLAGFRPIEILVNDLQDKQVAIDNISALHGIGIRQAEKEEIYRSCDIISLHLPLTPLTRNLIDRSVLNQMSSGAFLVNHARGGIVNEHDLYAALQSKRIAGAAVDVFEQEPYLGPLAELDNILLTQHMGSCSFDCRALMELQATEDVIRYFRHEPLHNPVPDEEFSNQGPDS